LEETAKSCSEEISKMREKFNQDLDQSKDSLRKITETKIKLETELLAAKSTLQELQTSTKSREEKLQKELAQWKEKVTQEVKVLQNNLTEERTAKQKSQRMQQRVWSCK